LSINRNRLYQLFKYTVYALLTLNIYLFFAEENAAAELQFANGVAWLDIIEAYSATIDTLAWVILLLMFELETWVLEDEQFTRRVAWSLHGLRVLCYVFIVYAFYGYVANLQFVLDVVPLAGVSDLCALAMDGWSYAATLDEYVAITAANCGTWTDASSFLRYRDLPAVVDATGSIEIIRLAWVDVINSAVWLLVVLVLEADVRLQEHNRLEGLALKASSVAKFVLYSTLFLAAVYWGVKGDFVDFWDAFLWLVAFVFIELNVFTWRAEEHEEQEAAQSPPLTR
jgi:hypothetical protein